MTPLTPPLPGEARPPTAAPSIPPCSGRGGVFPSAPSPAQEPHTTATGGGATFFEVLGFVSEAARIAACYTGDERATAEHQALARLREMLGPPCP